MRVKLVATIALVIFGHSCNEKQESIPAEPTLAISSGLLAEFPLMPHIEKPLWKNLLNAERVNDRAKAEKIAVMLRNRHPFSNDETVIKLGGIVYHKSTKRIEIPARVSYPVAVGDRHPDELELILCSEKGRTHETLFTTACRPLHLELILNLAGFKPESEFRVAVRIPDYPAIPVENLILLENKTHPEKLTWVFNGNPFQPLYQPDQTGDFIICWHAHESVLRVTDRGIADGITKLKVKKIPALKQGAAVKLELIYLGRID